jgi:hypothetical protein
MELARIRQTGIGFDMSNHELTRATKSLRLRWVTALLLLAVVIAVFLRGTYKKWPNAVELAEKAGRTVKFLEPFMEIFWWTAVFNLVVLVILAATARWWVKADVLPQRQVGPSWSRPSGIAWVIMAALLVGVFALRVPRLDMSLYNDESHNYARYFSGAWKHDPINNEAPVYRETSWVESLTRNMAGNNSQLYTLLARSTLDAWRSVTGEAKQKVVETPVRLPSLMAGVATWMLLGLLFWKWRGTVGLLWLLVLLTCHAWLVRFQSEARSYSVMLLGLAILFWFLHRALTSGLWRHWLGFGFGVLLSAWAFLGSAYYLIAVFLALMIRQVVFWRRGEISFQQVLRPLMAGMFAAMIGAQLFLGFIPPILYQLEHFHSIKGTMGGMWWSDVLSHLVFGSRWIESDPGNPFNFSMERLLTTSPWWWPAVLGGVVLTLLGWWSMVKRGGASMVLAVSAPLALVIAWALMSRKGNYLLYWYMIYAVPGFACCLAYGLANLTDGIGRTLRQPLLARGIAIATGLYLLTPQILCGIHWSQYPKQDERKPVEIIRGARYPDYKGTEGEKPLLITFWSNVPNYDPSCGILVKPEHLQSMIDRARAEKRQLFVNYSHSGYAEREHPAVVARLKDPAEFVREAVIYGQEEEQYTHYLFRWVGQ